MIDINYVQNKLDTEVWDMALPLRSWCRDLITEVRKLEARANDTTLVIKDFQDKVKELENYLKWAGSINKEIEQERDIVIEQFEALQKDNEGEDQYCHASLADGECNWERCPQVRDGEPINTARDCPLDIHDEYENNA